MRLKCIKLAGFKSFVDPTTAVFPSNLSAVVGPNGCGKSNIIDAVRWVMGESSAKNLRGESMTDVIFNGSSARKPVGQASIELVFDNSDASLGGAYAAFSEIALRRKVTRDGKSDYYLNGSKCRRRDITDIFLGTGLGPRSYAIIEQGMISRLIESKPEELRVFIEEAAGISKYKERRRETENRMRRTHENLERLTDIRDELERQLSSLKRQADAAERYRDYRQQERELKAQLQAMQWQQLDQQYGVKQQSILDLEIRVEACVSQQTRLDSEREKHIQAQTELNQNVNNIQARFYSLGADIARLEQAISHQVERQQQLNNDIAQADNNLQQAQQHLSLDSQQQQQWQAELSQLEPELELLQAGEEHSGELLLAAEALMQQWQHSWEEFNQLASQAQRQDEVQRSKISQLDKHIQRLQQNLTQLEQESQTLAQGISADEELALLAQQVDEFGDLAQQQLDSLERLNLSIQHQRQQLSEYDQSINSKRGEVQKKQGRLASLEALQQAALGENQASLQWLEQQGLAQQPRLIEQIQVLNGWDKACETVLGQQLQSLCLDDLSQLSTLLPSLKQGSLSFIDQAFIAPSSSANKFAKLQDQLQASAGITSLFDHIYLAEDLIQALAMQASLAVHESVVCRDGIWLGPNWLLISKDDDKQAGALARKQEIASLQLDLSALEQQLELEQAGASELQQQQQNHEAEQQQCQQLLRDYERQQGEFQSQLSAQQAQAQQVQLRKSDIVLQSQELQQQLELEQAHYAQANSLLQDAQATITQQSAEREQLQDKRSRNQQALEHARNQAREAKDANHSLALQRQNLSTQIKASHANISRAEAQVLQLTQQQQALQQSLLQTSTPGQDLEQELEALLEQRLLVEDELALARQALSTADNSLRQGEKDRSEALNKTQGERELLEQARLVAKTLQVERTEVEKRLAESEYQLPLILEQMPDTAEQAAWQQKLTSLAAKIQRLGAINLAAIDEYKTQSQRKEYLDAQNTDLSEALETLAGAIRKIDRETRARFKETFEKVNTSLQELFPKVFGGGRAYLELTGDDLLDTGIAIMAQPPGKRNSTIHLLSGGEKALTAIALVFSIFKLNPAPFCMLDEVDAPLDDANVGRYARMVKEMSAQVQFIYISHNKIAMEMADNLLGVTMHEPGVSRLVSVDIEAAAELAAQ